MQTLDGWCELPPIGNHIETALCRDLLALLWNETNLVRTDSDRDVDDLGRIPHFEIQLRHDASAQSLHIAVLNMAAIGTEMGSYAMGTGALTNRGGQHRIRLGILRFRSGRITCLSQSRDVINIYSETQFSNRGQSIPRNRGEGKPTKSMSLWPSSASGSQ